MSEEKKPTTSTNIPLLSYRKSEQKAIAYNNKVLKRAFLVFRCKFRAPSLVLVFLNERQESPKQSFANYYFFQFFDFFFFKIFLDTHIKLTSVDQLIACHKHINHLIAFVGAFFWCLCFCFGGDSSLGQYGEGGDCSIDP